MLAIVLILAAAGIAMIAMEVILPGGVLGVAGAIAIGISLTLTATSADLASLGSGGRLALGTSIVAGSALLLGLWLKFFTQASFVKNHLLESEVDGTRNYDHYQDLLHLTGTAETDLRPAGKARLDGKKWDVLAESGMIDRGSAVRVIKVEGSRVIVRAVAS